MIIKPALLNPLRFIDTNDINDSFDGNFAVNQLEWFQSKRCYFQPFQLSDRLVLQILADEQPVDLDIVDCFTNSIIQSISWNASDLLITGFPELTIYEIDYALIDLPEGKYYASLAEFTSEPFSVYEEQLNTVLLKYKNSENDKDVIFDTGIEFQFRVESWVGNYKPKNERSVYFDQKHNATQLFSQAYRKFTYYIGYSYGVPNWAMDKVNIITQCDQLTFNGVAYQVPPDAEFEVENNEDNNFIGGSIDIEPINNNFTKYRTQGSQNPLTFTPVQYTVNKFNQGTIFNVPNVFKNYSKLEGITVFKRSVGNFTVNIGTTVGGNDIGVFLVDSSATFKQFQWVFNSTTTVYVSGFDGVDADFILEYRQLDEPAIDLSQFVPQDTLRAGAKMYWETPSGVDINTIWDFSTGLGKSNSGWEKWTISGFNGTEVVDGAYLIGADVKTPGFDPIVLGDEVGANEKTITMAQLPAAGVHIFSTTVNSVGGDTPTADSSVARARSNGSQSLNYEMVKGTGTASLGKTSNLGEGAVFNVQPKSIISLLIVKLQD